MLSYNKQCVKWEVVRMATKESERLTYTVEEAGELLGISRATAYQLAREGRLPVIRISDRRLIIPKVALQRLLSEAGNGDKTPS
jgi:excisionase family DNA binding protein|tara:strand:+ start:9121 stop:9372 length:252 start_codon:yes stop_codon:yes gene_type:complete